MRIPEHDARAVHRRKRSLPGSRKLVSLLVTVGFLLLIVSGVVIVFSPTGRIAHRAGWSALGLFKEEWTAIHLTSSVLFLVGAILHGLLNWRPLLRYLCPRLANGLPVSTELAAALVIGALFVAGTLAGVPPLSSLVDLRENIRHGGETAVLSEDHGTQSRTGRGLGRMTLDELCLREGLAPDLVVSELRGAGIEAAGSDRIRWIADACGITPRDLVELIRMMEIPSDLRSLRRGTAVGQKALQKAIFRPMPRPHPK
jgi:hypothetical protein